MNIGEKIQQLRKANNLSQEQLAVQLEVSRQAVSKWELNESTPDTDKIILISRIFSVSTDYLLLENPEVANVTETEVRLK
jgi:transcriptional regulator with XRE-family HTH domain